GYRFEEGLKALFGWAETDGSFGWMLTLCAGANYFSRNMKPEVAQLLFSHTETCFGGSGYRFEEGLKALFGWAETDGSFGWMLTLCAGANY
ncbi:hypothetical protein BOQ60_25670, partial [Chryseobacterium sp. CH1]